MTAIGFLSLQHGDRVILGGKNVDAGSECIVQSTGNKMVLIKKADGSDFTVPNNYDGNDTISRDKKYRRVSYTILRKINNDDERHFKPVYALVVYETLYDESNNYETIVSVKGVYSSVKKAEEKARQEGYRSYDVKGCILDK